MNNDYHSKLKQLAVSCNVHPTTMANMLLERALHDAAYIKYYQDRLNIYPAYKIVLVSDLGNFKYALGGMASYG
jgi:hypothetical protein